VSAADNSRPLPPLPPRSRRARKLLRWLIIAFVLAVAYDYYFGPDDDLERSMPQPKIAPGRLADSPGSAVYQLYNAIAVGSAEGACFLFDNAGAAAFAHNFQSASCEVVVQRLQGRVDRDPRGFIRLAPYARHYTEISSCAVQLRAGTANLGRFLVTEPLRGEWIISGHRMEPAPCAL
jgi:hypothetical protein